MPPSSSSGGLAGVGVVKCFQQPASPPGRGPAVRRNVSQLFAIANNCSGTAGWQDGWRGEEEASSRSSPHRQIRRQLRIRRGRRKNFRSIENFFSSSDELAAAAKARRLARRRRSFFKKLSSPSNPPTASNSKRKKKTFSIDRKFFSALRRVGGSRQGQNIEFEE